MSNPVIFVSLGPGEPDLITLKGLKALQVPIVSFVLKPAPQADGYSRVLPTYCMRWIFRIPPSPALHCL